MAARSQRMSPPPLHSLHHHRRHHPSDSALHSQQHRLLRPNSHCCLRARTPPPSQLWNQARHLESWQVSALHCWSRQMPPVCKCSHDDQVPELHLHRRAPPRPQLASPVNALETPTSLSTVERKSKGLPSSASLAQPMSTIHTCRAQLLGHDAPSSRLLQELSLGVCPQQWSGALSQRALLTNLERIWHCQAVPASLSGWK
mmetsp:Transcript_42543/g.77252  ORF Transcript_42543/g.77252 Transcript_42543/m.77252 type:complete len:201 (+) Transcript_42543:235-837(+)